MSRRLLTATALSQISKQRRVQSWIWFLDIDGTLLDMAPTPSAVRVPINLSASLLRLIQNPRHHVALISGRSLDDIRGLFPNLQLSISGNHGAEYCWAENLWVHNSSQRFLATRPQVLDALSSFERCFPGILIEDKQYSLSVHYRRVDSALHPHLQDVLKECLASIPGITILPAKRCWEIRPNPGSSKEDAVKTLYEKISCTLPHPILPIIMGDDRTDEDAFHALRDSLTIHVGEGLSEAAFWLPSPRHVRDLLSEISRRPHLLLAGDHDSSQNR